LQCIIITIITILDGKILQENGSVEESTSTYSSLFLSGRKSNNMPGQHATVESLSSEEHVTFDRQGVLAGARQVLPIAFSVCTYGLAQGVFARQAGLSVLEMFLMSGLVFAGSSQFIALSIWVSPLPIVTILLTTLIVNMRYVLMGAALSPWFSQLTPLKKYLTLFLMADENWALTMSEFHRGKNNAAFLLGSGLVLFVAWVGSTVIGRALGTAVTDPSRWGLDFTVTAVFISLLVGLWRGKSDILPWVVAAVVAVAAFHWLPGQWYILLGGLAGSIIGAIRHAD
jgi:4-azaleucine resistance transporter AzlC